MEIKKITLIWNKHIFFFKWRNPFLLSSLHTSYPCNEASDTWQQPLFHCLLASWWFHSFFVPPNIYILCLESNVCGSRHIRQGYSARGVRGTAGLCLRWTTAGHMQDLSGWLCWRWGRRVKRRMYLWRLGIFCFLLIKIYPRGFPLSFPRVLDCVTWLHWSCLGNQIPYTIVWLFIQVCKW